VATQYVLLPQQRWTSAYAGPAFRVGSRTLWDIILTVSRITAGGSITVVIETSPTPYESDYSPLVTIGPHTAEGIYRVSSRPVSDPPTSDFTITPEEDVWVRARISQLSGTVSAEVRAVIPFFDLSNENHVSLLIKELRDWKEDKGRIIDQAEDLLINALTLPGGTGELDFNSDIPGAGDAVVREIAYEANWLFRIEMLMRNSDTIALAMKLSQFYPGWLTALTPFRITGTKPWFGR
jgi:hypothetical protein